MGHFLDKKLPFSLVNTIATWLWGKRGMSEMLALIMDSTSSNSQTILIGMLS